ncbi:MAG: divalent-cation tolerance protein CutA [Panacagrimonas sp.]
MRSALIALVSCPVDAADGLATHLVESRVAACVNVIPRIRSTYRWKGEVQRDDEALLIIKTTTERFEDLKRAVLAQHPYELPEVIAVDIAAGHLPYLDWIAECVSSSG